MAKKIAKLVICLVAIGSICAGVFYLFEKKKALNAEEEFDEDFDDFELDEDLGKVSKREYVSLTPSQNNLSEETKTDDTAADDKSMNSTKA